LAFACDAPENEWSKVLTNPKFKVKGPYTVQALEKRNMITIFETKKVLPFGYINDEWNKLKSKMVAGDQLYYVRYDDQQITAVYHLLVRQGCVAGVLRNASS
jgi:hypothetical protein